MIKAAVFLLGKKVFVPLTHTNNNNSNYKTNNY